ncbi:hypothetical protein GHT06_004663 [Daphnia sinensis]|uniref:Fibronectin type-III domain-containing protein n=1 Tax=Daphnia sinensis TaxID=1820382 RepID=A0AAD5KVU5_9CRUS|nr:hypothetical protein GHT06_004663 [Daphnia sinensis]
MSDHFNHIKMLALGRHFTIGSLYNYVEDVVVPNIRLWDPDDVSRVTVMQTERKQTIEIRSVAAEKMKIDEENEDVGSESLISSLGMDHHSIMSLTAGILRTPFKGAWQFASDRADDNTLSFNSNPEVVVHCRCSSRRISLDPKNKLEIICRPERLIKNQATHVVIAITYGLEAFCIFPQQNSQILNEDEMLGFARCFADGLLDGREQLQLDQDKEGDEEDGGHCLVPLDFHCILYKDDPALKKVQNWKSSNSVAEQYEACRQLLEHQLNKAVPLTVWLYPLQKLMPIDAGIPKMPDNQMDISRDLVFRCQTMWNRWQQIEMEANMMASELNKLKRSNAYQYIPLSLYNRVNDFHKYLKEFLCTFRKALHKWTVDVRRGGPEGKIDEMVDTIKSKSPFLPEKLYHWLNNQIQQIKTLRMVAELPGVLLVAETDQLERKIKSLGRNMFAVVLHLPSLAGHSDKLIHNLITYVSQFTNSQPPTWTCDTGYEKMKNTFVANRRHILTSSKEFSDWVTNNNATNIKYIVFYDQQFSNFPKLPFTRLYDCTLKFKDFCIPKAPGQVTVEKNRRGVVVLTWTDEEMSEESSYLIQYRTMDSQHWDSIEHSSKKITICHLQSGVTYQFRVAVSTIGGPGPFGPVSCNVTVDPVSPPPTGLRCQYVTDTTMTVSWDHDVDEEDEEISQECDDEYCNVGDEHTDIDEEELEIGGGNEFKKGDTYKKNQLTISSYVVDCWMASDQESTFIRRSTTEKTITLEPLVRDTVYCIQVRAVCKNLAGSTFYSPASSILETRTLREAERAAVIVRRVSKKISEGPGIDAYHLPLKKLHGVKSYGVGHYVFGEPSYVALTGKRRQRTILVLGATGSGKSTLINAMVNYVLGVEWEDDFRFKLINEPADKSQAYSQTDLVTTYDFYEMKGSRLEYSLTIVDTPGFGDTRGIEKDKKIMEQIQDYFKCRHGIQQLEAICFVVQSSLPRLTATQKYIFDSILSIFGQDIKDNIRLLVTFADNALPPVLEAVKEAGIPTPTDLTTGLPLHHKFNNSIFFTTNKGNRQTNEFNRTYFEMAVEGFDRFFEDLSQMEAKSLTLTREVLEERKRLEALVEGLQMRTEIKLTRVDELEQIKKALKDNEDEIEANKDFEYETLVPKATDISGTGQFTTNCQKCRTTCHFPCRQYSDDTKHRCSVMDRRGRCMICQCPWNDHFNQKYRYEMVKEKVQSSSDAIRQKYQEAKIEALTNEQLVRRIEKDIEKHESQLMELMQATYPCIQRLDEIALRPHSFSTPDYIDLMIAAEKQEHRSGYQQRIVTLQKLRKMAEMIAELIRKQKSVVNRRTPSVSVSSRASGSSFESTFRRFAYYLGRKL